MREEITLEMLLHAYQAGVFPMSDGRSDPEIFWVDPRKRGVMPLDGFHISRSLAKRMRRADYSIHFDENFSGVVGACAAREETWISQRIETLYHQLFKAGFAHCIEVRNQDNHMFGGVYGVSIGAAFFGESMFSTRRDGSKIALAFLVDHLRTAGFTLFDTQFITPHLASLGGLEIPRNEYHEQLATALQHSAQFNAAGLQAPSPHDVLQRNAQTS